MVRLKMYVEISKKKEYTGQSAHVEDKNYLSSLSMLVIYIDGETEGDIHGFPI